MTKLDDIVNGKGKSLVPQLHLKQIDRFLWRNGIELFPNIDTNGEKGLLINKLWKLNKTSIKLSDIWQIGATTGSVLLYLRPQNSSYRMCYFKASEFRAEYDEFGDLASVTVKRTLNTGTAYRWHKLVITPYSISKWESDRPIDSKVPDTVVNNRYGFIPCVVIENEPGAVPEFKNLAGQIETHDWLLSQTCGNVEFFGGPIFFSSRSKQEMVDAGHIGYESVAAVGGYGQRSNAERIKARRVFDNLEPGEQLGFASPEPISVGILEFVDRYDADIRASLGGVSETKFIDAKNIGTAEVKTLLARATSTSLRKAERYVTYGIAEAYTMMLEMARSDRIILDVDDDVSVLWRYLGDVFPETPRDSLTKSIVGRNLLRLGVNVEECIKYVFPDKRDSEIATMLKEGFAYEFLNGIASVAQTLGNAKDPETGEWAIDIDQFIKEVLAGRPSDDSRAGQRNQQNKRARTELVLQNNRKPDELT